MEAINILGITGVAAIVVICWMIGLTVKVSGLDNKWIPVICGVSGALLGALALSVGMPEFPAQDYFNAVAIGIVSGLGSVGCHQIFKQLTGENIIYKNENENTDTLREVSEYEEEVEAEKAEQYEREMED